MENMENTKSMKTIMDNAREIWKTKNMNSLDKTRQKSKTFQTNKHFLLMTFVSCSVYSEIRQNSAQNYDTKYHVVNDLKLANLRNWVENFHKKSTCLFVENFIAVLPWWFFFGISLHNFTTMLIF